MMKSLHWIVLLLVFLLAPVAGVFADDATPTPTPEEVDRSIVFYPEETGPISSIRVEVRPGETVERMLVIGNTGNIEQSMVTYAIPAVTAPNGGIAVLDYGAEPDAITKWLDYPEQIFTFAPGEGELIPVRITVPKDTPPGQYVTAVAAEHTSGYEIPGSDMFRQKMRFAVPVKIDVPGDWTSGMELGETKLIHGNDWIAAEVGITNTGTRILQPTGEVRLLDANGVVVGTSRVEMGAFLANTDTTFTAAWGGVPTSETYTLEVALNDTDGNTAVEQSFPDLVPTEYEPEAEVTPVGPVLEFARAELIPLTKSNPPTLLQLDAEIRNTGEPMEDARVSIVTYRDGKEVDRYPVMQALTITTGATQVQARYALPGGFTRGTYSFDVTIEFGTGSTQTIPVTQPLDLEIVVK